VLTSYERGVTASTEAVALESPQRRMLLAGPVVALVSVLTAVLMTDAAGLPLRDPDHVAGRRLVFVAWLVVVLIVLDVLVRASRRSRRLLPTLAAIRSVRRERWTLGRGIAVGSALVSFYVTYLAYRNLKSVVPLLRPGELFDRQLGELDRSLFGGNDPAEVLHSLLGTGFPTQVLSDAYMLLFLFIPGSLALALVFSRDLQAGLFYTTAQSLNWVLGAASYFLLPSLGPIYVEPSVFANLPSSEVSHLQSILLDQRLEFLRDPAAGSAQSIAAFSSLHVSIFFTAAVTAHLLGLGRRLKIGAWTLLGLTAAATIYFGWHYVLDDVGGLVIGALAIALARALTGFDLSSARRPAKPNPGAT
jgi:PAP2 superfamily protein